VDDEILAIDNIRVRPDQLAARLENYRPGQKITILAARRDELMSFSSPWRRAEDWQLEIRPDASEAQKQHLDRWLGK